MTERAVIHTGGAPAAVADDRMRVWFVACAALSYSLFGVLSKAPGIGMIANYLGIVAGIFFALIYVVLNLKNVRLRMAELGFFAALLLAVPIALLQSQGPFDIIGNFIRASFLIIAVVFWRSQDIDLTQLIQQLYSAFWKVAVVVTLFIIVMRVAQVPIAKQQHVPALIFLFAVTLSRGRTGPILAIVGMAAISGKEATYLAMLGIMVSFALLQRKLMFFALLFIIFMVFALSPVNPLFLGLNALGGNFTRLGEFLSLLTTGHFDDDMLNSITSNRYLEYQSVFQEWADNGIPLFGRGLGATVQVELGWVGEFVERSTLHNSYLAIFHTTGLLGLLFVAHYVFYPLWRLRKSTPEIVLVLVGYIVYAFFSNTLLQTPSLVFSLALAKRLSETQGTARSGTFKVPRQSARGRTYSARGETL